MLTQVACNQLHLSSFVRVFFFTFIALFSNGYKYHTNLDNIIHLSQAQFAVKKIPAPVDNHRRGESENCSASAILEISGQLNL